MTTKTQWEPDTCGCRLLIDNDTGAIEFAARCARHADLDTTDGVVAENRAKNAIVNALSEAYPAHQVSWKIDDNGRMGFAVGGIDQGEVSARMVTIIADLGVNIEMSDDA